MFLHAEFIEIISAEAAALVVKTTRVKLLWRGLCHHGWSWSNIRCKTGAQSRLSAAARVCEPTKWRKPGHTSDAETAVAAESSAGV